MKRFRRAIGIRSSRRSPSLNRVPPDFDEQTRRIFRAVAEFTMITPEGVQALVNAVRYVTANDIEGDFAECGVWRGGASMTVALMLKELGDVRRHLYLYDTFEGMSAPTDADVAIHGKAAGTTFAERRLSDDTSDWCRSPIEEVEANLASTGYPRERMHFVKGKVEETIPEQMPSGPLSILRLDTDWYVSTRHELIHLYPRLVPNGVLIIDDYGHWAGARKAVDEYFEEQGTSLLLNRIDYTARMAVKRD